MRRFDGLARTASDFQLRVAMSDLRNAFKKPTTLKTEQRNHEQNVKGSAIRHHANKNTFHRKQSRQFASQECPIPIQLDEDHTTCPGLFPRCVSFVLALVQTRTKVFLHPGETL